MGGSCSKRVHPANPPLPTPQISNENEEHSENLKLITDGNKEVLEVYQNEFQADLDYPIIGDALAQTMGAVLEAEQNMESKGQLVVNAAAQYAKNLRVHPPANPPLLPLPTPQINENKLLAVGKKWLTDENEMHSEYLKLITDGNKEVLEVYQNEFQAGNDDPIGDALAQTMGAILEAEQNMENKGQLVVNAAAQYAKNLVKTVMSTAGDFVYEVHEEVFEILEQAPMVGIAFSLLKHLAIRGKDTYINTQNSKKLSETCERASTLLHGLIKNINKKTKRAVVDIATDKSAMDKEIKKLVQLLHSARAYISKFSKDIYRTKAAYLFLMLSAKRDKQHFVDLSTGIEACVNHLMRMNQMSQMSCSHDYHNDMKDLAVEVAKVTGSEENVLAGFRKLLLENDPSKITKVASLLSMDAQFLYSSLESMRAMLDEVWKQLNELNNFVRNDLIRKIDPLPYPTCPLTLSTSWSLTFPGYTMPVQLDEFFLNVKLKYGDEMEWRNILQCLKHRLQKEGLTILDMKVEGTVEDGVNVVSHEISKEGEEEKGDESNMGEKTSLEAEIELLDLGLQLLAKHHFCIVNGIKDCLMRPVCFSRFLNRSDDIVKRLPKDDADRKIFLDELQKIDLVKMLELLVKLFDIKPILKKGSAELHVKQAEREGREAKLQDVLQADSSLARACQADIDNHLFRFLLGSREWIIHLYSQWLKEGSISDLNSTIPVVSSLRHVQQMHQRRAFVIYGAAGIGKSTIAAKLCSMERRESSIYAFHFCRHGDVLRRDPVAMIKSLALQLALELPCVYKEIMGFASSDQNLPSQETAGNDIERTFELFLLGPLSRAASQLPPNVIILIDALDECVGDAGSSHNFVLALLSVSLVKLPSQVRFVITSRPEPHIVRCLEDKFTPLSIQPDDPRHAKDLEHQIEYMLRRRGVKPTEDFEAAVRELVAKSEGTFVYIARVADAFDNDDRGNEPLTLQQVKAVPQGLYGTFTSYFDKVWHTIQARSHDSNAEPIIKPIQVIQSRMLLLLSLLSVACEPVSVDQLSFWMLDSSASDDSDGDKQMQRGGVADNSEVQTLLELLGTLFSVREAGKVYGFHKSIYDWMSSKKDSGIYHVDMAEAHYRIGKHLAVQALKILNFSCIRTAGTSDVKTENTDNTDAPPLDSYTLKHLAYHLLSGPVPVFSDCLGLLDSVLKSFVFIQGIFAEKGSYTFWVKSMGSKKGGLTGSYSAEIYKWLRLAGSAVDDSSTGVPIEGRVRSAACRYCPVQSPIYRKIKEHFKTNLTKMVLGVQGQCWSELDSVLTGHSEKVTSVAFSSSRNVLATGSNDSTARVWDLDSGSSLKILEGHTDKVKSVAFSPDGRLLATGSKDMTARVWDVESGICLHILEEHADWVTSVAFSPDGVLLATGSMDKSARVWDLESGLCRKRLKKDHSERVIRVISVAFSPDGKLLATGSTDGTAQFWDLESSKSSPVLRFNQGDDSDYYDEADDYGDEGRWGFAFSPNNVKMLATWRMGGLNDPALWDVDIEPQLASSLAPALATLKNSTNYTDEVKSLAFSPDGRLLAIAIGGSESESSYSQSLVPHTVRVWDLESRSILKSLEGHSDKVISVAFCPADGRASSTSRLLATGSHDKTARVWNLDELGSWSLEHLKGHIGGVSSLAFSPDGKLLATGSHDETARVWDLESGLCHQCLGDPKEPRSDIITSVAFSPDGKLLATRGGADKTASVWDLEPGSDHKFLKHHLAVVFCVAFDRDGKLLAIGRETKPTDVPVGYWAPFAEEGPFKDYHKDDILWSTRSTFSPDMKLLEAPAESRDDTMASSVWKLESEPLSLKFLMQGQGVAAVRKVSSIAYSPDGRWLGICGNYGDAFARNNKIIVWDLESGQICFHSLLEDHQEWKVTSFALSPDRRLLATGSEDFTAIVWDMESGLSCKLLQGHCGVVSCVAFSPDGKLLATGSHDKTARIWDIESGLMRHEPLEGHSDGIISVAFSPDGKLLATGSMDKTARVWDLVDLETDGGCNKKPI